MALSTLRSTPQSGESADATALALHEKAASSRPEPISAEEAADAIDHLRDRLEHAEGMSPPTETSPGKWGRRLAGTAEILDLIEGALPGMDPAKSQILAQHRGGKCVGLMLVEYDKTPSNIYAFVTTPEPVARGVGMQLLTDLLAREKTRIGPQVEVAVQLTAADNSAGSIYDYWGFVQDDSNGHCVLKPAESPHWKAEGDAFRFSRHPG